MLTCGTTHTYVGYEDEPVQGKGNSTSTGTDNSEKTTKSALSARPSFM